MGTSVLHIKTEVECRVYLFDEEKGIAKPGTYFNLEVQKGEQDLWFVSTEDECLRCLIQYNVEEGDCDYRMIVKRLQFIKYSSEVYEEIQKAEQGDAEGSGRCLLYHRRRRNPGPGRGIRLRQDDRRADAAVSVQTYRR